MKNLEYWDCELTMCIVIDTNAFASVFETNAEDHHEFRPILKWICEGKGKIVYGGAKYKAELWISRKYLRIFRQLQTARKTVEIVAAEIDQEQERLERALNHKNFDDPHLIAIVIVSGCKLICSKDKRAYAFIKDSSLYPKHFNRPRIYSSSSNSDLLCDQNIADCCQPAIRTKELLNMLH